MTLKEFRPEGTTGEGDHNDMFYNSHVTGPQGARFELFQEEHHTKDDIKDAKSWLKRSFDVVKINIIKETKKNGSRSKNNTKKK